MLGLAPALAACLGAGALGCPQEDPLPPPSPSGTDGPPPPTTLGTSDETGTSGGSADDTVTGTSTGSGTATEGETDTGPPTSCDEIMCQGHGGCELENGIAGCFCDEGYMLDEAGTTCVVDESCIELRFLEDHCRYIVNGPPAVTLFFAVDYCAGTAVLPEDMAEHGLEFEVFHDGINIERDPESEYTVIPAEVESYVTLVLDMSESVTGTPAEPNMELPLLVGEYRDFVQELAPAPGEPDVYVSIYVFGRYVREYVPFTRDYAALDAALAMIEQDPFAIDETLGFDGGGGTRLYDAVAAGIHRTQRIRDLRAAVTWDGVLSTGTVVVVTDGENTTGGTLDTTLVQDTLNQVISIGISHEVTTDDADLRAIGRDGSFKAPDPEDWPVAFDEVVERVDQYPQRAYLFGYCTSAAQGIAEVEVSLSGMVEVQQSAVCQFDASAFSVDPSVTCELDLFFNECDFRECGGLTACGACADDQCCDGSQCQAPTDATSAGIDCDGSNQLCNASGQICVNGACQDPSPVGGGCDPGCEPGVGYCDEDGLECLPAQPVDPFAENCAGMPPEPCYCESAEQCQSLNCRSTNPGVTLPTCLPPALVYDECGAPYFTVCEEGSYCDGNTCAPGQYPLSTCSSGEECRSGLCQAPVSSYLCVDSQACFWAWDEKVPA